MRFGALPLLGGVAGTVARLLPQDVFATSLYTGTGANQTITNGIDFAGKGGLVWTKVRNGGNNHGVWDTARGVGQNLSPNLTVGDRSSVGYGLSAFGSTGFSVSQNYDGENNSGGTQVAWSFRRAPKFFDIVTYTGDGSSNRAISHSLGIKPGMIIVKQRDGGATHWNVFHRPRGYGETLLLNTANASAVTASYWSAEPSESNFFLSQGPNNVSGATYVAYLFAHDPDTTNGIVQCGSFTGAATVSLGWQPQYLLVKRTDTTAQWQIFDSARGVNTSANDPTLFASVSNGEANDSDYVDFTATGFTYKASGPSVYLAIRAPIFQGALRPQDAFATSLWNNAPTSIANGLDLSSKGGLVWIRQRSDVNDHVLFDTQRGIGKAVSSNLTDAETSISGVTAFNASGFSLGNSFKVNSAGSNYVGWSFRRAPKVFDIVTYTGDGTSGRVIPHGLGIKPGMMIFKRRDAVSDWPVWHTNLGPSSPLFLNNNAAQGSINFWGQNPTDADFRVNPAANVSGSAYVVYLFAHDPDTANGIIQCGSFTISGGAGSSVNLGWKPQFVLVKTANAGSPWYLMDAARAANGGSSGADLLLSANNSAAEDASSDSFTFTPTGLSTSDPTNGNQWIYLAVRGPTS